MYCRREFVVCIEVRGQHFWCMHLHLRSGGLHTSCAKSGEHKWISDHRSGSSPTRYLRSLLSSRLLTYLQEGATGGKLQDEDPIIHGLSGAIASFLTRCLMNPIGARATASGACAATHTQTRRYRKDTIADAGPICAWGSAPSHSSRSNVSHAEVRVTSAH